MNAVFKSIGNLPRYVKHFQAANINTSTIQSKPYEFRLGIIPALAISVPCTYIGAMLAKHGAEFLEEWNIFTPEDDEDD